MPKINIKRWALFLCVLMNNVYEGGYFFSAVLIVLISAIFVEVAAQNIMIVTEVIDGISQWTSAID